MFSWEAKSSNPTDPSRKALETVHAFCVMSVPIKAKKIKIKSPPRRPSGADSAIAPLDAGAA